MNTETRAKKESSFDKPFLSKKRFIAAILTGIALLSVMVTPAIAADLWESDSSVVSGLGSLEGWSEPEVFCMNETWYLISGERPGAFYGWKWTGSAWESDSAIVSGLKDIGRVSAPTVFCKDGTWYLIAGEGEGGFYGFQWTGRRWASDSAIVSGLPDFLSVESCPRPTVFNKDGTWYLIFGENLGFHHGEFFGYNWTGSAWQSDPAIVSGLPAIGEIPSPDVFNKDGTWYLISGELYGVFYGFTWTGSEWQSEPAIVSGLGRVCVYGENSAPTVFNKDGTWYLISGEYNGGFYGWHQVKTPDLTTAAINVPELFVNQPSTVTATIANVGDADAGLFNVSLSADEAVVDTVNVPSLSAGNTTDVSFKWTPASAGDYELCVIADSDNTIPELDKTNNKMCTVVKINIVWQYSAVMPWDVERLPNGNMLITEYGNNTIIEVNPAGGKVWQYGDGTAGSGSGQLNSPIDAERLSNNTLITDSNNHRVIEIGSAGTIVWEMNATDGLSFPWDAERLSDDNTLITDKHNNRVIEVDNAGNTVWAMTGLNHPEDAERLSNNNTLIADYRNHRVIEVNSAGGIVWQYGTGSPDEPGSGPNELNNPTDAERLPNGNTLIADYSNHRVIEVTSARKIIGQYGTSGVAGSGENQLNHPADAERLSNGNTLIADTDNNRVIEVIALPPPPPVIVSYTPSSPVYDTEGATRTFSITIDQTVDVEWQLDGVVVKPDAGVTESSYTSTAKLGTWNVTAIASNANGTDMQQWDWISALGPELTISLIDAYHNKTLYPKENYPPYFNLSNEVNVTVTNIGTEPAGASSVSLCIEGEFIGKLPVSSIGPGASATVQFKWTPLGYDCEDGGSPRTYTLKAMADCDNDVNESVETNNELTTQETAYWAGYSADEELAEFSHGVIRGGLLYTTGDGKYVGLYSHGDYEDTHYEITLPDSASVKHARLNVYYTWSKLPRPVAGYPVMEVSITNDTTGETHIAHFAASYNDRPCDSPAISFEYPWGNYVYNLTSYITDSGSYTVRVKNNGSAEDPSNFAIAAPGLVILYEDSSMPEYEYWILEGADVVEGGRRGGAGYLSLEECTNDAVFQRSIDLSNVSSATLGMVSVWGGEAWGEWSSHYWFNDNYLGDGRILDGYFELYDKTIDGVSMYVGESKNAQVGANVSDVTDYIVSNDNVVTFGDNGDSMMPSNAFLLVERCREDKPEPARLVPFMVSGFVFNYSDGTPINNPDVTIKNLNTGELFAVETRNGSNYYQNLTSSEKVSCGDVLRFTCGEISTEHRVRQSEIDAGGFEYNITCLVTEVQPMPDLTVTEKNETLLEDGNFSVTYTVANIGDGNAGASNTTIYIDGVNVLKDTVPALAAGASYTNTVGPFECTCNQTLNVTVCADNDEVVYESAEGNNCMSNELVCPVCKFIPAGVTFNKKRLDLNSNQILNAFITLPDGYNVTEINVSTVRCEGASAELEGGGVIPGKDAFEAKFKIPDLRKDLPTGDNVTMTVTGKLYDGTPFEGSNTLKVVRSGKPPK